MKVSTPTGKDTDRQPHISRQQTPSGSKSPPNPTGTPRPRTLRVPESEVPHSPDPDIRAEYLAQWDQQRQADLKAASDLREQQRLIDKRLRDQRDLVAQQEQLALERDRLELEKQELEIEKQEKELAKKKVNDTKQMRKLMSSISNALDAIESSYK